MEENRFSDRSVIPAATTPNPSLNPTPLGCAGAPSFRSRRTRAPERAIILMVETAAMIPTGDA